jgi:hypothetical protein
MANFQIRIYVIGNEHFDEICQNEGIHDITDLTDKQFTEIAENLGTVYSLGKFLDLDVIAPDTDYVKAFFVDTDNENTPPIPADNYNTVITANKITCERVFADTMKNVVLFEEDNKPFGKNIKSEEPISRTYTIVLTNHDSENSFTGIIADIQDKDYVQDVDLLEEYDNKVRLQIETDGDIDFDKLCTDLEDWLGVTADLINEVENY